MKRLLASITVLSLLLAACSHNENNENDKKGNNSKTEHKDKKSDSNSKDKSKNHQKSQEQNDKNSKSNDNGDNNQASSSNQANNGDHSQTGKDNSNHKDYVAPYQSKDATQVARGLSPFKGNEGQALQQLPNFKTALDIARKEANMFGNSTKKYNDYSIEATEDGFRYVFSFKDSSKKDNYSIVTVNRQGEPTLIDPNYQP